MWPKVVAQLAKYPSAVVTALDGAGYPFSVRCKPEPDALNECLRLRVPEYVAWTEGPAGLLCHAHDEQLWNQTNVVMRGNLVHEEGVWLFKPTHLVEGAGAGMSLWRQVREGRAAAKRYLEKRNLKRPKIPWEQLKAIYRRAQEK